MPYRNEINVKPHDFAGTTTKVGDGESAHIIEGLEMLRVEPESERVGTGKAADGFSWFNKNPDRRGTITVTVPENSPSNTVLWDLYDADEAFSFSHTDPVNPGMKISNSQVRINRSQIERGEEVTMIEYTMKALYLNYRGAGYALAQQS